MTRRILVALVISAATVINATAHYHYSTGAVRDCVPMDADLPATVLEADSFRA